MKSFYLHAWNLTLEMPYGYCLGRYTLCWGLQGSSSVVCRSHAATSARCKQCLKHFLWTVWCTSQSPLRLGHYSHLILDEGIGTKSSLVLRNQGLDFWPQSSCPWPRKAICTSHGPADGCICSFPSERLISVTGQLPFPAFLTEAWWKQMCQRSPSAYLLNECSVDRHPARPSA